MELNDSTIAQPELTATGIGPSVGQAGSQAWSQHFRQQLNQLGQQQLLRQRGASGFDSSAGDDQKSGSGLDLHCSPVSLDFGSNDYLGLRRHSIVLKAAEQAISAWGWGSAASPVLSGYGDAHRKLEQSLAKLSCSEDCLVFSSGYACNVGVLSTLIDDDTVVFSDQLNHASLIDGIRLSRGMKVIYPHCDLEQLRELIAVHRGKKSRGLIVTESVFSMDGDEAPLEELVKLAEQSDCGLVVDEAHATGIFGQFGAGLLDELGLSHRVLVKLGTLSKAIGGIGGFAVGQSQLIELLVNRCRSYVFSTAPPAASMAAASAAVELLPSLSEQRRYLYGLSCQVRERLADQGWRVLNGRSPIVPMIIGDAESTLKVSSRLLKNKIYVPAIRPPTVPPGTCRLRISLSTSHTQSDIDRLCATVGIPP